MTIVGVGAFFHGRIGAWWSPTVEGPLVKVFGLFSLGYGIFCICSFLRTKFTNK
jgi:hypothetical protein